MINNRATIIPSKEGLAAHGKMFPSVVTIMKEGVLIGGEAKKHAFAHHDRTITAIKRKMGSDYEIKIDNKQYIPQQISAMILRKIKNDAETHLGQKIKKAVITCPAYFNDNQRTATRDAGTIAGLDVVRIINEPTAAALAYGLDRSKEDLNIAVLDLGGGTFDVTVLEMYDSVFKVLSTGGDTELGGMDMDKKIVDYLLQELEKKNIEFKDKITMYQLWYLAEKAKIKLSSSLSTNINLPFTNNGTTLTRAKLESVINDVVQRMDRPMEQALDDAKLDVKDIDRVILVGGPTKMPIIRKKIRNFFGKDAEEGIDPMKCVAIGAAIQASVLSGEIKNLVLLDITPLSLGIETSGAMFTRLIKRNTTIPTEESRMFTTAQDFQTTVPIHVLQGERPMASDNITLGVFNLTGIKSAPRHEPMIDVAFNIDANGILNVSAEDLETDKKQKIVITGPTKLPEKEINRMIKEAKTFAEEDEKKEGKVRICNRANALIYEVEKTMKEEKWVFENEKKTVEKVVEKLKETMRDDRPGKTKEQVENLTKLVDKIAGNARARKQANTLILTAKEMIGDVGIPEDEKENVEKTVEKLKETMGSSNGENIGKEIGELIEALTLLEVDYK